MSASISRPLLCSCVLLPLDSHGPEPQSAASNLVKDVVANELTDRAEQSNWMYRVSKVVERQTLSELEVETKDGPVHRLSQSMTHRWIQASESRKRPG